MRKILFPLYMKEDEEDFLLYQDAFVKEGFVFAKAEEEGLLLRADAVLVIGNMKICENSAKNALLETALNRNIPLVLVHGDEMPSLKEHTCVINAASISFDRLKKIIEANQQDIFRQDEKEPQGSRFFSIFCILLCAVLACLLLAKAVSFTQSGSGASSVQRDAVIETAEKAVVKVYAESSMNEEAWRGCGFVVDENGYIVTNAHVVDHAAVKYYAVYRGSRYEAEVIAVSDHEDIALIQIHTPTRYRLKIAEKIPQENDPLYAIGYPGDQKLTVLEGFAAGEAVRFDTGITYTPLHMALKSGISGSPVLNEEGEAAGIASAVSLSDENLSFMVPCDIVLDFLKDHIFLAD